MSTSPLRTQRELPDGVSWSGTWWFPDLPDSSFVGGVAWGPPPSSPQVEFVVPNVSPIFERLLDFEDGGHDVLHGHVSVEGPVTALGLRLAHTTLGTTEQVTYRPLRILSGVHIDDPDQRCFRRLEVEIPALATVLGRSTQLKSRPTKRSRQLTFLVHSAPHTWVEPEVTLSVQYRSSVSVGWTRTTSEMRPILEITTPRPSSLAELEAWMHGVLRFLEVVTGRPAAPASMRLWERKHLRGADRLTSVVTVISPDLDPTPYDYSAVRPLLNLRTIDHSPGGLVGIVRRAEELASTHPVFVGLLSSVIADAERPMHNRYLELTAALEAYHAKVHGVGPVEEDVFRAQRSAVMEAVSSAGLDPSEVRFVEKWLARRAVHPLPNRLSKIAKSLQLGKLNPTADELTRMRNDVAHGNAGVSGSQLKACYDQAFFLARAVVMHELGIPKAK